MIRNDQFHLNEDQLRKLTEWSSAQTNAMISEGCGESAQLSVTFSFSIFGRSVGASHTAPEPELILEDCLLHLI